MLSLTRLFVTHQLTQPLFLTFAGGEWTLEADGGGRGGATDVGDRVAAQLREQPAHDTGR